ncbi:hypothetical protein ACS0TY_025392 [Phlomoides rotata]
MVPHNSPIEHLLQHNIILGTEDKDRLGASIWIGTIWYIWKCRNELLFEDTTPDPDKITEEIKARTWSWIAAKNK